MRGSAVALAALLLAGCGGSSSGDSGGRPTLVVSAASSLRNAFSDYGETFRAAKVRLSFGGSDELAAQIRAGARIDVFAAANTKLPDQLYAEGKVERPVKFTANRLVIAVPRGLKGVRSIDDLARPGVKVAIGASSVPIGAYTRQVLRAVPSIEANRILANVKTEEPDVAGIIGKLTQGAVDAGFVYATDVEAARSMLRAIQVPDKLQPTVAYEAAIVKGTKQPAAAKRFLAGLAHGSGQRALRQAGFLPVP